MVHKNIKKKIALMTFNLISTLRDPPAQILKTLSLSSLHHQNQFIPKNTFPTYEKISQIKAVHILKHHHEFSFTENTHTHERLIGTLN